MEKSHPTRAINIIGSIVALLLLVALAIQYFGPSFKVPDSQNQEYSAAKESNTVELSDGDTFDLSAEMVTKELNGNKVTMMGYNGSIPGPTIKVKQNSTVTINFTNNTSIENTLHSHGIRVENAYDGVPDLTQKSVQPGESFAYKLGFKDPGVYWYHPHMREDMTQEMGLYGAFVVEAEDENYWNQVNEEHLIFLDDYLSSDEGLAPFYSDTITHSMMGRYGDKFFINGSPQYDLTVTKNSTVRFALLNAANARPFNIGISNQKLKLVGSDGGKFENETMVSSIIIGPSERYIFETYFDQPGTYNLQHITPNKTYKLGTITVLDEENPKNLGLDNFNNLKSTSDIRNSIPDFDSFLNKKPDKELQLNIKIGMMGGHRGHNMDGMLSSTASGDGIEWEENSMMNQMASDDMVEWQIIDKATGDINENIDWNYSLGDYVVIEIDNTKDSAHPMQHPIHFHGQRFAILSMDGKENSNLVWKDTVMVPAGQTYKILLEVSNPGKWMAHCHIAEHLHNGMMFNFDVKN